MTTLQRASDELDMPMECITETSIEALARIDSERLNEWINDALEVAEEWGD
jgi:hypothetical protein